MLHAFFTSRQITLQINSDHSLKKNTNPVRILSRWLEQVCCLRIAFSKFPGTLEGKQTIRAFLKDHGLYLRVGALSILAPRRPKNDW